MAFADYLDLRTAVIEHVARPDVADVFDRLTLLAEAYLNRRLRTRAQVTETTLDLSSGSAALPSDFAEALGLYEENGYEYVQRPLPDVKHNSGQGFYAVNGSSIVVPTTAGNMLLEYYAKLPTLTTSPTTTNWLLTGFPSVYLYAVGLEAAKYIRDPELVQATVPLLSAALKEVDVEDERARYSRARVRIPGGVA